VAISSLTPSLPELRCIVMQELRGFFDPAIEGHQDGPRSQLVFTGTGQETERENVRAPTATTHLQVFPSSVRTALAVPLRVSLGRNGAGFASLTRK
ncbi:MAG: hypothetical protein ACK5YO_39315, partial [Planctomyces sp.]